VKKIEFGLKGVRNYFWYRARVNLSTALQNSSEHHRLPVAAILRTNALSFSRRVGPKDLKRH